MSGVTLAAPLKLQGKPVTRVENYCATGSEALRQACYAVASGAYDVAAAVGVEKVKDSGYQGLNAFPIPNDGTNRTLTAAAMFSLVAPAYAEKYGVDPGELRRTLARIASKNHANGAKNPRAQFRREMDVDAICKMPAVAGMLSVFDCAGVADGAAAAIVVRAEDAHRYTDSPALREGAVDGGRQRVGAARPRLRLHPLRRVPVGGRGRLRPGRHHRSARGSWPWPRCTTASPPPSSSSWRTSGSPTGASRGRTARPGVFDLHGELPVNTDGGLKSFGHPVGASGLRMLFECWLQLRGEAPDDRRIDTVDRGLALTHNLGGYPGEMVSFVGIWGNRLG